MNCNEHRQKLLAAHDDAVRQKPELAPKLEVWTQENEHTGPITRRTYEQFCQILAENGLGHF
jgi:hypothetical protein